MKPSFKDLPEDIQKSFGNGCTLVFDFIFTASCQQHDFSYERGGGIKDYFKANWDMFTHMWHDSYKLWHYLISVTYWIGVNLFGWPFFKWSKRYKTLDEIINEDRKNKQK